MVPQPTEDEDRVSVRRAIAGLHAAGITAAQDAWLDPDELAFWGRVHDAGELALRFRGALIMEPDQTLDAWRERLDAYEAQAFPLRGGANLDAGILKGFVDGVVDARTAAVLAPYEGDTSTGLPAWTPDTLDAFVAEADRRGWQVELHAIGDRGVRMALDAFERAAAANGPWAGDPHGRGVAPGTHGRRHRVEHVEMIDDADVPRFGRLGVVASMQPYHGDPTPAQIAPWAANIGDRARSGWSWRRIHDGGRDPRVRVGLAGRAVRPVHRAQQRGQPADRRAASRRAAGPPSGSRSRRRSRRTRRAAPGRRTRITAGAASCRAWMRTSSCSIATCSRPVHLRSSEPASR